MKISLSDTGKRFNREWIFRKFSYTFEPGCSYAIIGPNGSGKSTLLQIIAGAIVQSEGRIEYSNGDVQIEPETVFNKLTIAAPYLELIEEMTITEVLRFHQTFKPLSLPIAEVISIVGLEKAADKQIRNYSSGMKQRVKLAQAVFSKTPCVLLDEPCTNLDKEGIALYHHLINQFCQGRLLIVSSNDEKEYSFCRERIEMRKDFSKVIASGS